MSSFQCLFTQAPRMGVIIGAMQRTNKVMCVCLHSLCSGKWHSFNDAVVTELDQAELNAVLGATQNETDKDSSSNAYMLEYRLEGMPCLSPETLETAIGGELRQEIADEDAEYLDLLQAFETSCSVIELVARTCDGRREAKVLLLETVTLAEAVQAAQQGLQLQEGGDPYKTASLDCLRVRKWDFGRGCPGETFEDDQVQLSALNLGREATLMLEVRSPDEQFVQFNPHEFVVHCVQWDSCCPGEPGNRRSVVVPGEHGATVADLRKQVEQAYNQPEPVLVFSTPQALELLSDHEQDSDDPALLRSARMVPGDQVWVEWCPCPSPMAKAERSLAVKLGRESAASACLHHFQELRYTVELCHNSLEAPHAFGFTLPMDTRLALRDAKERIAEALSIEIDSFHLKRSARAPMLQDESKTLESLGLITGSPLYVAAGAVRQAGEVKVKLSLYDPSSLDKQFTPLVQVVTRLDETVGELKARLTTRILQLSEGEKWAVRLSEWAGTLGRCVRLRDRKDGQVGKILLDDTKTLQASVPRLKDGRDVAVQLLQTPEMVAPGDLVLQVRWWRCQERKIDPVQEVVVCKTATAASLCQVLATQFGLEGTLEAQDQPRLGVAKGSTFGPPLDTKLAARLKWDSAEQGLDLRSAPAEADDEFGSVSNAPLSLRDGSLLLVRDNQDYALAKAAVLAARAEGGAKPAAKKAARKPWQKMRRGKETGIEIHVATTVPMQETGVEISVSTCAGSTELLQAQSP
eukprot:TRINITY_DN14015_c0_g1_i1.p1 TRINITY_DN14015_c0_g1~~TRINITY_DN14015_c0_g1_i1.p1  ORF type:complete len:749 (+),score=141.32 TRINITY_DN14015_c0_g1_i1:726-2972(+)